MKRPSRNQKIKEYYRDCGQGVRPGSWWTFLIKLRGLPSSWYQKKRLEETKRRLKRLNLSGAGLDAGCGRGYFLKSLPQGTVGIEINPRHVKRARIDAPQALVIQGDIEDIAYPKESFDFILAAEIFEHLLDPRTVVAELWRVLKKGGKLIVTVPTSHFLWRWRFLASSMSQTEPQCLSFNKKSLLSLWAGRQYQVKEWERIAWGLNYWLVLEKK